jgi:ATP-dependent Clp protease ATP-binding subunit ClpA
VKIYQIYIPELAVYVKFKVLEPEQIEQFVVSFKKENKDPDLTIFRKKIVETFVFNLQSEIKDSLRMMSRQSAESCLDALFNGCIMLNPGLDIDLWLSIAYTGILEDINCFKDDDILSSRESAFIESLKNNKKASKRFPKINMDDFPFDISSREKIKPKIKQITKQKYFGLENHLKSNVIGQNDAIENIVSSLRRSQAGMSDIDRPLGVFLFAGSSGVGKTHLATTLHKYLFGNEYPLVRIDCGEFQHKHENQKLIGSPPGYVGHDEGGQLVNQIKQYPSSVVLLDEVEKAHPDLWNTFLRVFDNGLLTDAKGEIVNFRNTIIIMTTNLGNDKTTDHLLAGGTGFNRDIHYKTFIKKIPDRSILDRNTNEAIRKHFRPEFLNRIDKVIVFNYLSEADCNTIAKLEMSITAEKLIKKGYLFEYNQNVIDGLITKGIDSIKGARGLAQIRREQIETPIADSIINNSIPRGSMFELLYEDDKFKFNVKKPNKKTGLLKEV